MIEDFSVPADALLIELRSMGVITDAMVTIAGMRIRIRELESRVRLLEEEPLPE